ncbi:MAG: Sulfite oxidase-like oxidoreductase [Devosia sp.]|nr:Sulfite oxidase-like oxidoreductase [Devosia sp.]
MTDDPDIPADSKLTRSKSRWAELGKFLTGLTSRPADARLPPGQHLVRNWPVLDLGQTPNVTKETWRLDITGAVDATSSWTWNSFMAQPQETRLCDIHCVTSWSRYDNSFAGVSTQHLLEAAGVSDTATHVVLHSNDGYTTNLTIEDFARPENLIAHSWNGEPLTLDHGGPVRLVVPHLYFWKSAKWLRRLDFVTADHPGFWELRGYHNRGDPWEEQRYS